MGEKVSLDTVIFAQHDGQSRNFAVVVEEPIERSVLKADEYLTGVRNELHLTNLSA